MTCPRTQQRAKPILAEHRGVASGASTAASSALSFLKFISENFLNGSRSHGAAPHQLRETHPIWGLGHALGAVTLSNHLAAHRPRAAKLSTNASHKNVTFVFGRLPATEKSAARATWKAFVKEAFAAAHKADSLESVFKTVFFATIPKMIRHQHGSIAGKRDSVLVGMTIWSRAIDLLGTFSLQTRRAAMSPVADL